MAPANQHLNTINKFFEEVYTNGNTGILDQLCTNDVKLIDPTASNIKKGLQGLKEFEINYKMAFLTKMCKIDQYWLADNAIIVQWTTAAIHKGTFEAIPATGKSIKMSGISIYKFSGNKICEIIQQWDRLNLFEQLGLSFHAEALR